MAEHSKECEAFGHYCSVDRLVALMQKSNYVAKDEAVAVREANNWISVHLQELAPGDHGCHRSKQDPRDYRNKMRKHTAAEVSDITIPSIPVPLTELIPEDNYLHNNNQELSQHDQDQDAWYDIPDKMRPEDAESLRQI
ncbi:hypothetical protein PGT21_020969 [Puccinia graminis f. sp. tritici]|uniref:Uncharacterized protein n=1 Tax=Puccinia graminis f. sp. tritici TaxID=56615 RepID=A0A5B0QNM6_PUCGR|nr:hypothetical protein PGT21_020969 [Puccinia graminis f. sp. tritici]